MRTRGIKVTGMERKVAEIAAKKFYAMRKELLNCPTTELPHREPVHFATEDMQSRFAYCLLTAELVSDDTFESNSVRIADGKAHIETTVHHHPVYDYYVEVRTANGTPIWWERFDVYADVQGLAEMAIRKYKAYNR